MPSLGLFETLVPIASILTTSFVVGYTLPRQERFGLFLLIWWALSVGVSLQGGIFHHPERWSVPMYMDGGDEYSDVDSTGMHDQRHALTTAGDGRGMAVMLGLPCAFGTIACIWISRSISLQRFLLEDVPLWSFVAMNVYRLDSLSLVGSLSAPPTFLGFYLALLDAVLIGATSVPLTVITAFREERPPRRYVGWLRSSPSATRNVVSVGDSNRLSRWWKYSSVRRILGSFSSIVGVSTLRSWLRSWNLTGIFNLFSAYLLLIGNFGRWPPIRMVTEPSLSRLGFHPFPLIVIFHAPLAMLVHALLLISPTNAAASKSGKSADARVSHPTERLTDASPSSTVPSIGGPVSFLPLYYR